MADALGKRPLSPPPPAPNKKPQSAIKKRSDTNRSKTKVKIAGGTAVGE